jgi:hypothetical protein
MAATIPDAQINAKLRPTKGFRQETSSAVIRGNDANNATASNPKIEANIEKSNKEFDGLLLCMLRPLE